MNSNELEASILKINQQINCLTMWIEISKQTPDNHGKVAGYKNELSALNNELIELTNKSLRIAA